MRELLGGAPARGCPASVSPRPPWWADVGTWITLVATVAAVISIILAIHFERQARRHAALRAVWANRSGIDELGHPTLELRLYNDGDSPAREVVIRLDTYMYPDQIERVFPGRTGSAPDWALELPYLTVPLITGDGEPFVHHVCLGAWYWEDGRTGYWRSIEAGELAEHPFYGEGGFPPTVTATIEYSPYVAPRPRNGRNPKPPERVSFRATSPSVLW